MTELAKDFNYILYYFGIKDKVYEPKGAEWYLAFRGWHYQNGNGRFFLVNVFWMWECNRDAQYALYSAFKEIMEPRKYWTPYDGHKLKYFR